MPLAARAYKAAGKRHEDVACIPARPGYGVWSLNLTTGAPEACIGKTTSFSQFAGPWTGSVSVNWRVGSRFR